MAAASAVALKLGGFLLAHAFWIVAELEEGDAYVPQALCENEAGRQLFVFEAETQVEAVNKGKQFLSERGAEFDRCAFARDGLIRTDEGPVDVLILDIVEGAVPPKLTVIQPYGKSQTGDFQLLGNEVLLTDGRQVPLAEASELTGILHSGASDHERATEIWQRIDAERTATSPL